MRFICLPFAAALACAAGEGNTTSTGFGSSASSPSAATNTMTGTGGDIPTTGSDTSNAPASTVDVTSQADAETGVASTTDNTTVFDTNIDGLANGLECMNGFECQTGNCYKIPLPLDDLPPGICSECDSDQDCVDKGLGISCTVDAATLGAACTDGGLGSFCESMAACKPQYWCDEILNDAEGLLPHSCGECRDDVDCKDGKRCTPRIDLSMYTGNKYCAAPGSVPNDGLCPEFTGNGVCANNHCNVINVVGTLDVGICGECTSDADCTAPKVCTPGMFSDTFTGSKCM